MDSLHTVLRSFRRENDARREPLDVFREFLDHLDRAARRRVMPRATKAAKARGRRGKR